MDVPLATTALIFTVCQIKCTSKNKVTGNFLPQVERTERLIISIQTLLLKINMMPALPASSITYRQDFTKDGQSVTH